MKKRLKNLLVVIIVGLVMSCEKDYNYDISKVSIEKNHQEFKKILVSNSIEKNNKIWISDTLDYTQRNATYTNWASKNTPFFVGFSMNEDNTCKIFVTMHTVARDQVKSKGSLVFDNPNTYRIGGIYRTTLTVLTQGILSNLKPDGLADFDYMVEKFSKEEIVLDPFYPEIKGKFVFKPYPYNEAFISYLHACDLLYSDNLFRGLVTAGTYFFNGFIQIRLKSTGNVEYGEFYSCISNALEQYYDKNRSVFAFKIRGYNTPDEVRDRSYIPLKTKLDEYNIVGLKVKSVDKNTKVIIFDGLKDDGSDSLYEVMVSTYWP